jgi:uncharacterized protein (TIGR03086 family)
MDPIDAMARSYEHTTGIIGNLRPEHAHLATPCPLYDVQGVFNHLVGVLDMFAASLSGGSCVPAEHDLTAEDPLAVFTASASANADAWRGRSDLSGDLALPFGNVPAAVGVHLNLIDVLVHGWDIASAIGAPRSIPDDLAAEALAFSTGMLKPEYRSEAPDAAFGPEVAVPDDAPMGDRLVAFLGRRP